MKYLFFLLSLCTPVISSATWGVELLGGTNMHIGPMSRNMLDKGSKPGWTGILKLGGYFRKIEFGMGVETGRWNYTNEKSGYPLYHYTTNYNVPRELYGYKLGGNNYTSAFAYFNYKLIDRKMFCSVGLTQGLVLVGSYPSDGSWVGKNNYVAEDGNIPASSGITVGAQVALGYNVSTHLRLKLESGIRWGVYSFRNHTDYATGYEMIDFPITVGIVFHNFS
ncbi:MAG TPA: hypothetical protein VIN07_02620, partial [Flavipsychrobacter sp.]